MNLLVTGGAGYIGVTVATLLLQAGHRVTVLNNLCHSQRDQVPLGVDFLELDIGSRRDIEALLGELKPDAILHFAALIEAGESMEKPEIYFRNKTASTLALLEAMHAARINRLVFSSTAAVYGEPRRVPIEESASLDPIKRMLNWFQRIHGLQYGSSTNAANRTNRNRILSRNFGYGAWASRAHLHFG